MKTILLIGCVILTVTRAQDPDVICEQPLRSLCGPLHPMEGADSPAGGRVGDQK